MDVTTRLKFIEIFESHPAVWDKSSPEFRSYQKRAPYRNETWVSIARAFAEAGVKIKMDCLRQTWIHVRTPFLHFMSYRQQKNDKADYELHFHEKLIALGGMFIAGMQLPQAEESCEPTAQTEESAVNPADTVADGSSVAEMAETIPPTCQPVVTTEVVTTEPINVLEPEIIYQEQPRIVRPTERPVKVEEVSPDECPPEEEEDIPPPLPMHRSHLLTAEVRPENLPLPIYTDYAPPVAVSKEPKMGRPIERPVKVEEVSPDECPREEEEEIPPPLPMNRSHLSTVEVRSENLPPPISRYYTPPVAVPFPKELKMEVVPEEFAEPGVSASKPMDESPPPPVVRDFVSRSIPKLPEAVHKRKRKSDENLEYASDAHIAKKSSVKVQTEAFPAPSRISPTSTQLKELHITFCPKSAGQWSRTATIVCDFANFTQIADGSLGTASQYDPVADETIPRPPLSSIQPAVPRSAQAPPVPRHRSQPQPPLGVPFPSNFMHPPHPFYNFPFMTSMQMDGTIYDPVHEGTFHQQTPLPTGTIYDKVATQAPAIPPHSKARKI